MTVQQTSLLAYYDLKNLSQSRKQVYDIISLYGPVCDVQIADILHRPINTITPRRNELVKDELIEEVKKDKSPTGKLAIFWGAK